MSNEEFSPLLTSHSIIDTHIEVVMLGTNDKLKLPPSPAWLPAHFTLLCLVGRSLLINIPGLPWCRCGHYSGFIGR